MSNLKQEHYVYVYLDPRKPGKYKYDQYEFTFEPFYIGKGKDNRCKNGLYDKNKSHKYNKIKAIKDEALNVIILKLYENMTDQDACLKEIDIIKKIGRSALNVGPLVNHTDGGDGMLGTKHTQEWKDKLSIPVIQYDLNMNLIYKHASIRAAAEIINITPLQISRVCSGKKYYKTAGGFIWKFKDKEIQGHITELNTTGKIHTKDTKKKMSKPKNWKTKDGTHPSKGKIMTSKYPSVLQYDLDMNLIKEWSTINELCIECNYNISYMIKVLHNKKNYAYKYYWKFT